MKYFEIFLEHINSRRWMRHLLFWFGILLFYMTKLYVDLKIDFLENLIWFTIKFVPTAFVSYFLAYYWIPKLMQKKKYFKATFSFLLVAYISSVIFRLSTVYIGEPLTLDYEFDQEPVLEILTDIVKLFSRYFVSIFYAAVIFLFVKYFGESSRMKEKQLLLEKVKAEGELKALRAQLNPHFLFNTLNNIYSLSLINSPKTPESIERLSGILDHLLYKCNSKFVPLSSEIELLNNYLSLEKLRYDERLDVKFHSNIDAESEIAPLVLLSLVENAFKHGAGEDDGSPMINISLDQSNDEIIFLVKNSISTSTNDNSRKPIGLINIRKQLDLIYDERYQLDAKEANNMFEVKLIINTKNQ